MEHKTLKFFITILLFVFIVLLFLNFFLTQRISFDCAVVEKIIAWDSNSSKRNIINDVNSVEEIVCDIQKMYLLRTSTNTFYESPNKSIDLLLSDGSSYSIEINGNILRVTKVRYDSEKGIEIIEKGKFYTIISSQFDDIFDNIMAK